GGASATPSTIAIGATSTIAFAVSAAAGLPSASHVRVAVTLPSGLTFVSGGASSCTASGAQVACDLGTLDAGAPANVSLLVEALAPGSYDLHPQVNAQQPDKNATDNMGSATVVVSAPSADLSLTLTAAPTGTAFNDFALVAIVQNHGPSAASMVQVAVTMP